MKINRWKMALLIWSAMFPFSTLLSYGFSQMDYTAHCPLVVRTFLLTCFLVPYMVFGVFPFITRRFHKWLQVRPAQSAETPSLSVANPLANNKKS